MINYTQKAEDTKMERWRRFASDTMERFPPAFLIVLLLMALYRALDSSTLIPSVDWLAERFGITADFWQTVFLLSAGAIAYYRPSPRVTLILSLPAALLGVGVLWFGFATGRDAVAITYIFLCWIAIGVAMVVMILYHEQLVANELMAKKIAELQKERDDHALADVASPAPIHNA